MIGYPDSFFLHIEFYDTLSIFSPTRNLAMQIKVATATIAPPANPISFSEIFVYTVPPNHVPQPIPRLKIPENIAIATDEAAAETQPINSA